MQDEEIIELYFKRDDTALEKTAEKYKNYCISIAERILGNKEEAEEYFGIDLCLSEEIRDGIRAMGERQKEYNVGTAVQVNVCTSEKDPTEPIGMVLQFSIDHDFKGNYTNLAVFVSFSDEYRDVEKEWYSYEKEGKWKEQYYKTKNEKDARLIYNDPQDGFKGCAIAVWEKDGIGYFLNNCYTGDLANSAKKNIIPYIQNLE